MATFSPTITTNSSPVTITSANGNVTYQTLQNSLGSYIYIVDSLYFQSQTSLQQVQPFQLISTNENGTQIANMAYNSFSLFQRVFASTTDFKEYDFVLDGFTNMDFTILSNENLVMVFEVRQFSVADRLGGENQMRIMKENNTENDTKLQQTVTITNPPNKVNVVKENKQSIAVPLLAASLIGAVLLYKN